MQRGGEEEEEARTSCSLCKGGLVTGHVCSLFCVFFLARHGWVARCRSTTCSRRVLLSNSTLLGRPSPWRAQTRSIKQLWLRRSTSNCERFPQSYPPCACPSIGSDFASDSETESSKASGADQLFCMGSNFGHSPCCCCTRHLLPQDGD